MEAVPIPATLRLFTDMDLAVNYRALILPLVLLLGLPGQGLAQNEKEKGIHFTCSLPQDLPEIQRLHSYYRDAFAALGYQFSMTHKPAKRSLAEAVSGVSDGECARAVETLEPEETAELVPVNVVVGSSSVNVWSREDKALTLEDLASSKHVICYVDSNYSSRFWLEKIKTLYPDQAPAAFTVNSEQTALRMLAFGRLTHCIGPQLLFRAAARKASLSGQVFDNGKLGTVYAQPLLHKDHRALAEPFSRELKAIVEARGAIATN